MTIDKAFETIDAMADQVEDMFNTYMNGEDEGEFLKALETVEALEISEEMTEAVEGMRQNFNAAMTALEDFNNAYFDYREAKKGEQYDDE